MNEEDNKFLDQALLLLAEGKTPAEIYSAYPEFASELMQLLPIAQLLQTTATNTVPAPTRHYKFAKQSSWQKFVQLFVLYRPMLVPALVIVLFVSGGVIANAANHSLPGDRLFPLRVASEKTRLSLTFDQEKVANFHVQLAQKRLDDVKKAIENSDPDQEKAALLALTQQTEKTVAAVSQLATNKAINDKDTTLLDNLVSLNKEQKTILAAAVQSEETKEQATSALDESKEVDLNLAKIIATVNEQELLDLPNKISITGIIPNITNNRVIIEKNIFIVDQDTVIVSSTGDITSDPSSVHGKITVIGTRENNTLRAKKIVVLDADATLTPAVPIVKGVVTTTPISSQPATPKIESELPTEPAQEGEASGGFIVEPSDSLNAQ